MYFTNSRVATAASLLLGSLLASGTYAVPQPYPAKPAPKPALNASDGSGQGNAGGTLRIPQGTLIGKNGVSFGWLPDSAAGNKMSDINGKIGKKGAAYGWYSQITSSKYDDSQLTQVMSDLTSSGATFIPAVMPTKVKFSDFSEDLAQQVADSMKKFTDKGIEVWLRFAHEMNWYVTDGTYAGGSAQDFVKAWQTLHKHTSANPKVKLFWSPNSAKSASDLTSWFPGPEYVDMVGMDVYPDQGKSFKDTYGDFYDAFAKKYNKPFVIGETGSKSSDTKAKEQWLKELTSVDLKEFPLYKSCSWFEYDKEGTDFRVVIGQDGDTVQETKGDFA